MCNAIVEETKTKYELKHNESPRIILNLLSEDFKK